MNCIYYSTNSYLFLSFNPAITALKRSSAPSKFSTISSANSSGSGRLSKSARDLSFIQVMSKEVLSLAMVSKAGRFRQRYINTQDFQFLQLL